ncbi:MAG: metallophosphoesterase [Microvirga sp.]
MILSGQRLDTKTCKGLLIIGDPHVSSRRPGRRKDPVWPEPVLAKLRHCVAIANERDLLPVILGDLFDRPVETDESLKTQLIRMLKSFRHRPLVNVGNHDIRHTTLSDGDTLALLGLCDVVDVVSSSGPVLDVHCDGHRTGIGMTPFGQAIPGSVRGSSVDVDRQIWFTHHDIAFEGSTYPGALPPFAVEGCDLLINGHIHKTQKGIQAGHTRWLNPGNITRQSVDLLDHRPRAWILDASGELQGQDLPWAPDVFDLTGRLVPAASDERVAAVESAFVSLLRAEAPSDMKRSDDGSVLREEIEAKFVEDRTPEAIRAIVRSLLAEAVVRRDSA